MSHGLASYVGWAGQSGYRWIELWVMNWPHLLAEQDRVDIIGLSYESWTGLICWLSRTVDITGLSNESWTGLICWLSRMEWITQYWALSHGLASRFNVGWVRLNVCTMNSLEDDYSETPDLHCHSACVASIQLLPVKRKKHDWNVILVNIMHWPGILVLRILLQSMYAVETCLCDQLWDFAKPGVRHHILHWSDIYLTWRISMNVSVKPVRSLSKDFTEEH